MAVEEARTYLEAGEFPKGSMGPKVEAAIQFLERGGQEVLITTPAALERALGGETGTRILPDPVQART
jgi:carbamate kinase